VEYSESPAYNSISPNESMYGNASAVRPSSTSHSVTITDLRPNTQYHYRVRIKDAYGNQNPGAARPPFSTSP
jgi:phosphodiesterase/alkaline phosphatase D-like protein